MYRVILAAVLLCLSFLSFAAKAPKPVDELEVRVEALEAAPRPIQVLANGESIGLLLDVRHSAHTNLIYGVLSNTGYYFSVYAHSDDSITNESGDVLRVARLRFEAVGCVSQAYVSLIDLRNAFGSEDQGAVFRISEGSSSLRHFYVPAGSVPAKRQFIVSSSGSSCDPDAPEFDSVEAFPIDPAITGVPNEPFTPPITLGQ